MTAAALHTPNWEALLRLELRGSERTRLVPLERYGPLSVQRPFYPEGKVCHVYLLHPPAGVVGGDRLTLQVSLLNRASALLTTPGANRFYLSAGDTALVEQRFEVGSGAALEFLPQENIYFPGARVRSRTSVDLVDPSSRALVWEKHCFGRPANHERFSSGQLVSSIDLRVDGDLLFTETQRIDAEEIASASGLRGHAVTGTFIAHGEPIDRDLLETLQTLSAVDGVCAVTQPHPGLLVARYLGDDTRAADAYFIELWRRLRPLLMRRDICCPRIWNT